MYYEVLRSRGAVNEWRVEAIDHDGEGEGYIAIFSGPSSRERAEEYAAWKNAASERRTQNRPVSVERRQHANV